jgi:polysaccharide biosynthesis/export protein
MLASKNSLTESGTQNGMPATVGRKWLSCICALLALTFAACSTTLPPPPRGEPFSGRQKLVPGDVIRISFPGAMEMDQTQRIPSDGRIALPMIGEVRASGKTLTALQAELVGRYKTNLTNSTVTVSVVTYANIVYVNGAVVRPAKVQLDRGLTLYEALVEAGGISRPYGDAKKVLLQRIENGEHKSYQVDVSPLQKGLPVPIVYLKPYDIIFVPGTGSASPAPTVSYGVQ